MTRHLLRRKLDFTLDFVGFTVSGLHIYVWIYEIDHCDICQTALCKFQLSE